MTTCRQRAAAFVWPGSCAPFASAWCVPTPPPLRPTCPRAPPACAVHAMPAGPLPDQDLPPQRRQAGPHLSRHFERQVEPRAADPHRAAQVGRRWLVCSGWAGGGRRGADEGRVRGQAPPGPAPECSPPATTAPPAGSIQALMPAPNSTAFVCVPPPAASKPSCLHPTQTTRLTKTLLATGSPTSPTQ